MSKPTEDDVALLLRRKDDDRIRAKAQNRARVALIEAHPEEYRALYAAHKAKLLRARLEAEDAGH